MAWPADGGRDGLGRSLSVDSSGQGRLRTTPPSKTPLRAAQRVGFLGKTVKMGAPARFRPDSSMLLSALRRPDDGGRTEPVVSRRPAECLQVRTAERVVFNPKVEAVAAQVEEQRARGAKETRRAGLFEQPVDDPRSERRVHHPPRRPRLGYVMIPVRQVAASQPRDVALIAPLPPGQLPKHRASGTRQVENVTKVVVVSDRRRPVVGEGVSQPGLRDVGLVVPAAKEVEVEGVHEAVSASAGDE